MNYHSLFYYRVLSVLRNLKNGALPKTLGDINFNIGWQHRDGMRFRHNFERERFLRNRPRYIYTDFKGDIIVLLKEHRKDVTIYKNAVKHLFDDERAEHELVELMSKFYTVTIEPAYPDRYIDLYETGREPGHARAYDL